MASRLNSLIRSQMRYVIKILPGSPFRTIRNYLWNFVGFDVHKSANLMPSASLLCGKIKIDENTFIGDDVLITGGDINIGKNCDIAPRVILHAGSHLLASSKRRAGKAYFGKIIIGDGTWIGTGSTIIDGAILGSGVVVAAGSVVIKGSYPNNSILAGNPVKIKKIIEE